MTGQASRPTVCLSRDPNVPPLAAVGVVLLCVDSMLCTTWRPSRAPSAQSGHAKLCVCVDVH